MKYLYPIIFAFLTCMHGCNYQPQDAELKRQVAELRQIGEKLQRAILDNDPDTLARLLDKQPREWGYIELGEDNHISIAEAIQELTARDGYVYAKVYDTAKWRQIRGEAYHEILGRGRFTKENIFCVRDHLLHAGKALRMEIKVKPGRPGVPTYGHVIFDWPGKELTEWTQDPVFGYTRYGWQMWIFLLHD